MKKLAACTMFALAAAAVSTSARAGSFTENFDGSTSGYTLAADGAGSSALSTEQALSAPNSVKFTLPNTQADFAKVIVNVAPGANPLGATSGTFQAYVPSTSAAFLPYLYFGVDSNKNGVFDFNGSNTGDSFVIAFEGPAVTFDNWQQVGLSGATNVHVVGNRTGIADSTFSSSGTQDTLANLGQLAIGGGTWADLDVLQVRIGAGETGGPLLNYSAYVDNLSVVPEPTTLAAIAGGAILLLGRRRRRA